MPFIEIDPSAATVIAGPGLGDPLTSTGETLATLRAELNKLLGVRDDADSDRLDMWINEAYRDFTSATGLVDIEEAKGSLSFNLVANEALYLLPDEVRAIRSLVMVDNDHSEGGLPLIKKDLDWFRRQPVLEALPRYYFRENQVLVVHGTPDEVKEMVLEYWIEFADLEDDTDSPRLPKLWHEGIKLLARVKALDALRDFSALADAENSFTRWVRRRVDKRELEDENRPSGMQPVRDRLTRPRHR